MSRQSLSITRGARRGLLGGLAAAILTVAPAVAQSAAPGLFGEPIGEKPAASADSPYVTWDAGTCGFVPAEAPYEGPYQAVLRGKGSHDLSVVWTPQDTVNDNVILATQSMQKAADAAGARLSVISNNYPDSAQPLKAANDAVTLQPDVVLSMNVFGDLQPAIFDIYKAGCIPAVAFSVTPPEGTPYLAGSWADAGRLDAEYVIARMAERGWTMADTTVLFCLNGALGTAAGGPYDAVVAYDTALAALDGYDKERVSYLDCSGGTGAATPETTQAATRDWLTAHPDAEHILMFGGPDANGFPMYNALQEVGRGDQAMVTGIALTKPVRALLLAGDPTYVGSVDFGLNDFGPYGIAVAQDIVAGNPVPSRLVMDVGVVDASTIREVLEQRGTTE